MSFALAERLGSPILSADSRQLYAEIPIGTAAPTKEEQERVFDPAPFGRKKVVISTNIAETSVTIAGITTVIFRDTKDEFHIVNVQDWIDDDDSLSGKFGY